MISYYTPIYPNDQLFSYLWYYVIYMHSLFVLQVNFKKPCIVLNLINIDIQGISSVQIRTYKFIRLLMFNTFEKRLLGSVIRPWDTLILWTLLFKPRICVLLFVKPDSVKTGSNKIKRFEKKRKVGNIVKTWCIIKQEAHRP